MEVEATAPNDSRNNLSSGPKSTVLNITLKSYRATAKNAPSPRYMNPIYIGHLLRHTSLELYTNRRRRPTLVGCHTRHGVTSE